MNTPNGRFWKIRIQTYMHPPDTRFMEATQINWTAVMRQVALLAPVMFAIAYIIAR